MKRRQRLLPATRSGIAADLRAAGIAAGETLVVHSALSQVGWFHGGPEEFLGALQDAVGPDGTLVLPTFSFNLELWDQPAYRPWESPSRVGLASNVFRAMPGVRRSLHPTHSVAAWGRRADFILDAPLEAPPLGVGSALDRACEAGARILLAGVGQERNSSIHLAESHAAVPYLDVPFTEYASADRAWYFASPEESARLLLIRGMPGTSQGFDVLEEPLRHRGVVRDVRIGNAMSQLMEARALVEAVSGILRDDPLYLIRHAPDSEVTDRRIWHTKQMLRKR